MCFPLGVELPPVGGFEFRQSTQGLLKMFVAQPAFHRRSRKEAGRFAVATTSVLARFTHRRFHLLLAILSLLRRELYPTWGKWAINALVEN